MIFIRSVNQKKKIINLIKKRKVKPPSPVIAIESKISLANVKIFKNNDNEDENQIIGWNFSSLKNKKKI